MPHPVIYFEKNLMRFKCIMKLYNYAGYFWK